jgi:O-acetylhomoserine/O-acetylserine sulfhydrylase-like pyridoxal-dependent enzyme
MSRTSGMIHEIFVEGGVTKARVSAGGNHITVALTLLLDARVGDEVVISSGIAHASLSFKIKEEV